MPFYYIKFIKKWHTVILFSILLVFLTVEISFFIANIAKIKQRWMFLIFEVGIIGVMYVWHRARKITGRYIEFVRLENYISKIQELSTDRSVPKYANHLVFLTSAGDKKEIEHKIMYSILNKKPKRADIYWFVHMDTMDDPYTYDYKVNTVIPNEIIRIDLRLGFRRAPKVNLIFQKIIEDLASNNEVRILSKYEGLERSESVGGIQFIVMEKYLSEDNELGFFEKFVLNIYFWLKQKSLSEEKGFGLDQSNVVVEKFPLIVTPLPDIKINRIY